MVRFEGLGLSGFGFRFMAQGPGLQLKEGVLRSEDFFCQFFCFSFEFSCFFLLFLWFSEHALLVLPVVLLWREFFSVYFSGFCW